MRQASEVHERDTEAPSSGSGAGQHAQGIEVVHSNDDYDVYGGRGEDGGTACMLTVEPPVRGWLGNPYRLGNRSDDDARRDVIAAFMADFLNRVDRDPEFRTAVRQIDGTRVACWSRHDDTARSPSAWCHLDVVDAWLRGDYRDLLVYLRGNDPREGFDQLRHAEDER